MCETQGRRDYSVESEISTPCRLLQLNQQDGHHSIRPGYERVAGD
jgi:hypothetical protein